MMVVPLFWPITSKAGGRTPMKTSIRALMTLATLAAVALTDAGSFARQATAEERVTLLAAGDVAMCDGRSASESMAARTAALIERMPGTVIVAGDLAYWQGSEGDFTNCYDPTWGRFKARTLPVPGNHEYESPEAAPYYAYWGSAAGQPGKGYYSVQVGSWRVIGLNSNIAAHAGSEQERWLREELKTNRAHCTLAFWHHPVFSSGSVGGNNPKMRDIFQALEEAGADLIITGHDHTYERFAPQTAQGSADSVRGIREFIVGTGGGFSTPFRTEVQPNSEVRKTDVFGVLKLTLRTEGYAWEFVPIEGQTFRDAGEGKCHD
jgi:3',5'-cyclic AMP phosphodiesterase CpdA